VEDVEAQRCVAASLAAAVGVFEAWRRERRTCRNPEVPDSALRPDRPEPSSRRRDPGPDGHHSRVRPHSPGLFTSPSVTGVVTHPKRPTHEDHRRASAACFRRDPIVLRAPRGEERSPRDLQIGYEVKERVREARLPSAWRVPRPPVSDFSGLRRRIGGSAGAGVAAATKLVRFGLSRAKRASGRRGTRSGSLGGFTPPRRGLFSCSNPVRPDADADPPDRSAGMGCARQTCSNLRLAGVIPAAARSRALVVPAGVRQRHRHRAFGPSSRVPARASKTSRSRSGLPSARGFRRRASKSSRSRSRSPTARSRIDQGVACSPIEGRFRREV